MTAILDGLRRLFADADPQPETHTMLIGDAIEARQAMLSALAALHLSLPRVRNDGVERACVEAIGALRDAIDRMP